MMGNLYRRPLRVYILLGFVAFFGIVAGTKLPISLFPNSSQPELNVHINYGDMSIEEFNSSYGMNLEGQLKSAVVGGHRVEMLTTEYRDKDLVFRNLFEWGTDGEQAQRDIRSLVSGMSGAWPEEIRNSVSVNYWNENGGFLAVSFFSQSRSLDEVYDVLNPLLSPYLSSIQDSSGAGLWNPQQKSIEVILNPEKMAGFQVMTTDVEKELISANYGYSGGNLTVGEGNRLNIVFPKGLKSKEDVERVWIHTPDSRIIQLKDIATVKIDVDKKSIQSFKTSGATSLILFADPKPGGNIKRMADDVMAVIEKVKPSMPKDIEYRVLVNPSQFIDASIKGVIHEVGLSALLAVIILFIFVGSFKNVATAAIEIPLSIVMAFIFMKAFNMNLNLISLGGLALSAGMNVDASVVVMENIFRHFAGIKKKLDFEERLAIVIKAVDEVKAPIISSTIASLVVFIPLIATNGLTNAILGDLAKAVVFSHSLSAVVALILVPTIRLQLMSSEGITHPKSLIEGPLIWLEKTYVKLLNGFIKSAVIRNLSYVAIIASLVVLVIQVGGKLPKEIIGRPETDWIILGVRPQNFTEHGQLVNLVEKVEYEVMQKLDGDMRYTFTQLRGTNDGMIMIRLNSKKLMDKIWKKLEEDYVNSPEISYWVAPWNPSELRIPDPPHFKLEIRGGIAEDRAQVSQDLRVAILESKAFPRVNLRPEANNDAKALVVKPYSETLFEIAKAGKAILPGDISHYLRIATQGKSVISVGDQAKTYALTLRFDDKRVGSIADLKGLPIGLQNRILPVSALAQIETAQKAAPIFRIDQSDINQILARENESNKANVKTSRAKATAEFEKWIAENQDRISQKQISVQMADADVELNKAIDQLKIAILLSIVLIFITMILQFGDLVHGLLVLVSVPLGVIGVFLSLWIFKSTLSLNSVLGIILLNGISVANSVILVDFMKKLYEKGYAPIDAALFAAKTRLRPILMTSLTTVLGMLPVALGLGEGGRILQPLGIAVSGGLWVSMSLTLFLVPALQVAYLNFKQNREREFGGAGQRVSQSNISVMISKSVRIGPHAEGEIDLQ